MVEKDSTVVLRAAAFTDHHAPNSRHLRAFHLRKSFCAYLAYTLASCVGILVLSSLRVCNPEACYRKHVCANDRAPVICRFANRVPVSALVSILISLAFDALFNI